MSNPRPANVATKDAEKAISTPPAFEAPAEAHQGGAVDTPARHAKTTITPPAGWAEQDSETTIAAMMAVLRQRAAANPTDQKVANTPCNTETAKTEMMLAAEHHIKANAAQMQPYLGRQPLFLLTITDARVHRGKLVDPGDSVLAGPLKSDTKADVDAVCGAYPHVADRLRARLAERAHTTTRGYFITILHVTMAPSGNEHWGVLGMGLG